MVKKYTQAEKLAYYKKKAAGGYRKKTRGRYVRGQGAYKLPRNFFSAPKVGRYLGETAGGFLGNYLAPGIGGAAGAEVGNYAGDKLGRLFKSITGWGDYNVKSNSLMFPDQTVPSFGDDSIRVRKREFVASIDSLGTSFNLSAFPINPGLDTSFPWLSAIAQNYEQYHFNGLIYQFVSTSSDAIASTTALGLGQIILATDYNAVDDSFQSSPQMLGSMFSNSGKPSENIMHAIECAPDEVAQKLYYVRTGSAPTGSDRRLWDLGVFQIATDNMPAAYSGMGQLWVSYDITFYKSVQNNTLGLELNSDFWHALEGYTPNNANPFGSTLNTSTLAADSGSSLGCVINNSSIYFPSHMSEGYYQITMAWGGTAAAFTAPTFTTDGCDQVNCWYSNSAPTVQAPANGTSTANAIIVMVVRLNDNWTAGTDFARITLAGAALPSPISRCAVAITQVNGEIYDSYTLT